jgi:drug/metabolite transporter (DMT)-like permease
MCLSIDSGLIHLPPAVQWQLATSHGVWLNMLLLVGISTMLAFGLMFYFQPLLDPTRAALLYLAEPVFAALFAYMVAGRTLSLLAICGAGLLIMANGLAEFLARR